MLYHFLDRWELQTGINPRLDRQLLSRWMQSTIGNLSYLWDHKTETIIGYSMFSESRYIDTKKGTIIASHANKVLRGYYELGAYLKIRTLMEIKRLYPNVEIVTLGTEGTISQKEFKESFLPLGGIFEHKITLLYKDDSIKIDPVLLRTIKTMWVSDLFVK